MLEMYINGVRHIPCLLNGGYQGWAPQPNNPQNKWTEDEWRAVANFQKNAIELQQRAQNTISRIE